MYRTIYSQLWTDKKVARLTVQGKLLFLYLITNPHTHLSGLYYLPYRLICEETGLTDTLCHTLFDTLSELGLAHEDRENKTVFVVNMFSYQGQGEKNEKCAAHHLDTLHDSCLIHRFLERYPKVKQYCSDTLSDTLSYRGTDPSKRCPSVPVPNPDPLLLTSSTSLKSKIQSEFTEFWTLYPKKVGKGKAEKLWQKLDWSNGLFSRICEQVKAASLTEQWMKERGKFIPHPATWLHEKRWEDTYEPAHPGESVHHGFAAKDYRAGTW